MSDPPIAPQVGGWAADTVRNEAVPADVIAGVPGRVLDIAGIAVRATQLPTSVAARDHMVAQSGSGKASTVGLTGPLAAPAAAFINGVLAHSLDYDDTHLPSILHPSATVVPATLAAAEAAGATGSRTLSAITVGIEITVRLGMAGHDEMADNNAFFEQGLHATSICGAIGAAASAAAVAGADGTVVADAMGVAASLASGIIEANRTGGTVKRLHCGWAAHAAVTAADLAARGFTGPPTVFEGRFGLLGALLGEAARPAALLDGLGDRWETPGVFYKPYPANHFTHTGIDAAIRLRQKGLRADEVAAAELGVAAPTVRTIGEPLDAKQSPATGYQAQFSGPYTVAAALTGGSGLGLGLADFADERVADPGLRALAKRVSVAPNDGCSEIYPDQFPAVLEVQTFAGESLSETVLTNRGGPGNPLSEAELNRKFQDNVAGLLTDAAVEQAATRIATMATAGDVGAVLAPLRVDLSWGA